MLKPNEGKTCDAVIRRLETRQGCVRSHLSRPEIVWPEYPIEIAFALGKEIVALEHTLIEPFEGHVRMEAKSPQLYKPITDALNDLLGTDSIFRLQMPVNALDGRKQKDVASIQNSLIAWVKRTAPTIPPRPHPDYRGNSTPPTKIDGVPFTVTLWRYQPPIVPGRYFELWHTIDNLEQRRRDRIKAGIDKKFPKLAEWKRDCGARTVLVLEENDIQLTNPSNVMDAYLPLVKDRKDTPDETYLVATCFEPWHVWPILIDSRSYADIVKSDETEHWEFDPAKLLALTDR